MIDLMDNSLLSFTGTAAQFLLTYTLKSTVLLAAAMAMVWLCRKSSASVRHSIWSLVLVSILLLPVASLVLPSWGLSPLPSVISEHSSRTIIDELQDAGAPAYYRVSSHSPKASVQQTAPPLDFSAIWPLLLVFVWLTGVFAVVIRAAVGLYRTRQLIRKAVKVDNDAFHKLAELCAARVGITRPVGLLTSRLISIPLTAGWLHPVVVVPNEASDWTERRIELVLLHEFAHIRRRDVLYAILALTASTAYWFNPLVWLAARQLTLERERASDDRVLASGMRASEYAHHLLDIARSLTQARWSSPIEVTMAQKKSLEGRLLAILDRDQRRHTLRPVSVVLVATLITVLTITLASIQTWAESAQSNVLQENLAASTIQPWTANESDANTNLLDSSAVSLLRQETDRQAVLALLDRFNKAFQDRDLDGMLDCLSRDMRFILEQSSPGGIDTWKRKTARKYYDAYTSNTVACKKLSVTRKPEGYFLSGPTAVLGVNRKGMNILIENKERVLLCKQEDGLWKIAKTNFLK